MGVLVDGVWHGERSFPTGADGAFERPPTRFRDRIDRAPGARFAPERGRYHLHVSLACPWAHRTLVVRRLKGLEDAIGVSVVNPIMAEDGWTYLPDGGVVPDPDGARFLREVYLRADPRCSGRVTVPVLWDRQERTIVSNESAEIIRMLDAAFDGGPALAPPELAGEMEALDATVYETVNNGVYRAGFAASQGAYEAAFAALFATLDALEARLADGRSFLFGEQLTLSDIRLWTTLVRFDAVYHGHFKCNRQRLVEYPHLWRYTRRVFGHEGIGETVDLDHIKRHYYGSHVHLNPSGIVPVGPALDFFFSRA
jgi:glutathionyl-hydroquinone reductase